jgi:serine protease AprX
MCRSISVVLGVALALSAPSGGAGPTTRRPDRAIYAADPGTARVRVIVRTDDAVETERVVATLDGRTGRRLSSVPAVVAEVPESAVGRLASSRGVRSVHLDRRIHATLERTAAAIGARWISENLGFDGSGVGVAIIDSGVARGHEDLVNRIAHFANFIGSESEPHDRYGHGTHVAGIIAGSGYSSGGARRGIAPGAHLIVLKALDDEGDGYISAAIAALDYAIEQRAALNIRIINLSVAAGVYESYRTDPLTLAAARAVDAGIVVVTAAGNLGRNPNGVTQYGGITAPGNAPWVLTVGAATHNGTVDRGDDVVAPFSSLGPSAIDLVAKPDIVAPGVGIESAADPGSTLFGARPDARVWGTLATAAEPYLSLSGTSMAAPVVAGTIALMLQANPSLTPAEAKAILQGSAEFHSNENKSAQGAGFLDARAAVELARTFAESPAATEVLDGLVQVYETTDGGWTPPCGSDDMDCRYLTIACAAAGCFEGSADRVVSTITPSADTTVWTSTRRSIARSTRGEPQRHRFRGHAE